MSAHLKHRIIVMNGQRVIQVEGESAASSEWKTVNVGKAGNLQAGVYQLDDLIELDEQDRRTIERCLARTLEKR